MKLSTKLAPVAVMGMLASMYVTPAVSAEVTAGIGIANMYLWRGVNEGTANGNNGGAQVSGELKAALKNGVHFGTWLSSSGIGGSETDLIVGYGAKNGNIEWDVSYVYYLYPEYIAPDGSNGIDDTNVAELIGSVALAGFSGGLYFNVDSDQPDDLYITLGYDWSKYNITFGQWIREKSEGDEYSHLTLSYAATDALSFTLSKAFQDKPQGSGLGQGGVEKDPLFRISYGWSFDLKKK